MSKWLIALIVILVLLAVAIIIRGLNYELQLTRYYFQDARLKESFKIILITDLHSSAYGKEQEDLLQKVREAKPDLILMSGDIIDDRAPEDLGYFTVEKLLEISPCYYVTGNHEFYKYKHEEIKEKLGKMGVEVLAGDFRQLTVKNNSITIAGLDDPWQAAPYEKQLEKLKAERFVDLTLLLAHRPERLDDYARLDVDYVFSGHAHGGQWRFPGLLENGLYAPHQGLLPQYTKGVHEFEKNNKEGEANRQIKLIVSRGLSKCSPFIFRLYNPPEIVEVNFSALA